MAVKGLNRTETCIVHHDQPAAARCGRCHKPICAECIVSTADGKFCSEECGAKVADYRKNEKKVPAASGMRDVLRLGFWLIILILFLGVVNKFMMNGDMPYAGKFLNMIPFLGK